MLFDWSTFFLCFLSINFFSMTLLSFCKVQEEESLWTLEYLFLVDGWHVLCNSWCRSYLIDVGVRDLDHGSMERL
jgi:hypothetical protein